MRKKIIALLAASVLSISCLVGCSSDKEDEKVKMRVGMVTDSGTIDDKSFNQGTWEGIKKAADEMSLETRYLKPDGSIEADYLKEIGNLYDAGYKFIVTPGVKFQTAIYKAQDQYKDAKFVIMDGDPKEKSDDIEGKVGDNTVAIYFAEHEAGFVAGVATALEMKDGELGFIGGMKVPAVQKFNWGYQQGIKYANENLGTSINLSEENVIYQGSFDDANAGTQIAGQMYDRKVKAIFCAAGGVGNGVISEAKTRAAKGEEVWVVGVDGDQYKSGVYKDGKSVILTSAMKRVDTAAYDMIKEELDGKFQGGKILTLTAKDNAVGLPSENPNLSEETVKKANEILQKIKSGDITVADKGDGLIEPK